MANKKIRELTQGTISANNDYLAVATTENTTVKVPYSALATVILQSSLIQGTNITITDATEQDGLKRFRISADTGSVWYYGTTQPVSPNDGDYWIDTTSGNNLEVYQYTNSQWTSTRMYLKGEQGSAGTTPTIDSTTKHWIIGSTDTGVIAEGQNGTNGTNGITPHIDSATKHWFIGEMDTNVVAEGQDGDDGSAATISVGTITTGSAGTNATVTNSGTSSAAVFDFIIPRGVDGINGTNGTNGYSISATTTSITGGHSITVSSTDPEVSDITFNVMDGLEVIQTSSDDRTVTLTADGWTGDAAPYTQTVTVLGITSSIIPIIGLSISDAVSTGLEQKSECAKITKAITETDTITFKCYEDKPTVDLTLLVKVV